MGKEELFPSKGTVYGGGVLGGGGGKVSDDILLQLKPSSLSRKGKLFFGGKGKGLPPSSGKKKKGPFLGGRGPSSSDRKGIRILQGGYPGKQAGRGYFLRERKKQKAMGAKKRGGFLGKDAGKEGKHW